MKQLIPKIVIGKKYLYQHTGAMEARCPHCNYIFGSDCAPFEVVVTVLAEALESMCPACRKLVPMPEGWYCTDHSSENGYFVVVPYTQLTEIEGEDYVLSDDGIA